MKNVLVVDCNDSFVYNLVQLLRESQACTFDIVSAESIDFEHLHHYSHILLSPGPGLPNDFPNLHTLLQHTHTTHSILGVCLGLQAIAEYFGGALQHIAHPQHGHESALICLDKNDPLLKNIPSDAKIGHYHSWCMQPQLIPDCLTVTAKDDAHRIMAIRHNNYAIFGVQFHPESIITTVGKQIIQNWLNTAPNSL